MSERVNPEELRTRAELEYSLAFSDTRIVNMLHAAADTIEALTAERDEAVALLRTVATGDDGSVWNDIGAWANVDAFLARLDQEGGPRLPTVTGLPSGRTLDLSEYEGPHRWLDQEGEG